MSIILLVALVFATLTANVCRHQTALAKIRQGSKYVLATAFMSTIITAVGDTSTVELTSAIPKPESTVFSVPEVRCYRASCKGNCGKTSRPYMYTSFYPCSCDKDCIIYQDCCLDFGSLCTDDIEDFTPGQIIAPPEGTPHLSCVYHQTYSFYPIYMVAECPEGYKQEAVKALCEGGISDYVLHHLPIAGSNSSFVYRNIYCAICNSLNMSSLETFTNYFLCPFNETASKRYLEKRPLHEITFTEIKQARCEVQILLDGHQGRTCVRVDLDNCQEPGAVKDACKAYSDPIEISYMQPKTVARNKYCARCNDLDEQGTFCWAGRIVINKLGNGLNFSLQLDFKAISVPGEMSVPDLVSVTPQSEDLSDSILERGLMNFLEIVTIWISYRRT